MSAPFSAADRPTALELNIAVDQLVAYGERLTGSTTTTTIVGVLDLAAFRARAGRSYRVCTGTVHPVSTVAGDGVQVDVRFTTAAYPAVPAAPSTASAVLKGGRAYRRVHTANSGEAVTIDTKYEPGASDLNVRLLLCVSRFAGTGNVKLDADGANIITALFVYDVGLAVANSGTAV